MIAGSGWDESAAAWIAEQGEEGDYGRRWVLDGPMLARVRGRGFRTALDLGCGEGRFSRMLKEEGVHAIGLDPTEALLRCAQERDPAGEYRLGRAEALPFPDAAFALVVSYLTLVDIADLQRAVIEIAPVLKPGSTFLFANLTSFNTAGMPTGWREGAFNIDRYLEVRPFWAEWRGIRIRNWHRPLSLYMTLLLERGFELRHFAEPAPTGGDPERAERHRRVPFFHIMEWEKRA